MNLVALAVASVAIGIALGAILWRLHRITAALGSVAGRVGQLADRVRDAEPVPALQVPLPPPPNPILAPEEAEDGPALGEERDARIRAEGELASLIEAHRELEGRLAAETETRRTLEDRLEATVLDASHDRRALILLMDVASGPELLGVCRDAIASLAAKPAAPGPPNPPPAAPESSDGEEPDPFADDPAHKKAARIARVLVADLFLYNESRLDKEMTEEKIRSLLERQFRGARETFDGRVAASVRSVKDYLEVEYQRALSERVPPSLVETAFASESTPAPTGPDAARDEHADARRMARLMIAQLLLANRALVEEGIRNQDLRRALDGQYQAMRQEFEANIAERVWKEQHYLDAELRRVVEDWDVRESIDAELNELFTERFD